MGADRWSGEGVDDSNASELMISEIERHAFGWPVLPTPSRIAVLDDIVFEMGLRWVDELLTICGMNSLGQGNDRSESDMLG